MNVTEFKKKLLRNTIPERISYEEAIKSCMYAYDTKRMRPNRFNGKYGKRSPKKIDTENLGGKIAEFAVYNMFVHHGIKCKCQPDIRTWTYGADKGDLEILLNNKPRRIEIKSTKLWGSCLLLDRLKWVDNHHHIINHDHRNDSEAKQIPYIFIAVNLNYNHPLIKNFHILKNEAKPKHDFDMILKHIPRIINQTLTINIMGMISGKRFGDTAKQGTKANLFNYIPTAKVSEWSNKPSDVHNFAFPYHKWCLNNEARKEEINGRRHISCTIPAKECLKDLIQIQD